jgi:hypothetical protein
VVVVGWSNGAHQVASIRDSAGNSYALGAGISKSGVAMAVYFAKGIAGSTSNTVTVDLNSDDYLGLAILEYSGVSRPPHASSYSAQASPTRMRPPILARGRLRRRV